MPRIVLSSSQAEALLDARRPGAAHVEVSPDLGLTAVRAAVEPPGVRFPGGELLAWDQVEEMAGAGHGCFLVEAAGTYKVQVYSELADRCYALWATSGAPTVLNAGIPMHRVKDVDPMADTLRKIRAIAPVKGAVLDTATGLGYTAIRAARTAARVVTVEMDPAMLELARLNPWSQELFDNPNIVQVVGDAFDEVQRLEDRAFSRIIHDPPTFSMAGHLYSGEFYRRLHRVLRDNGRLFHYLGDLASKRGRNLLRGVRRRLQEAGFGQIVERPAAFGVVARK